MLVKEKVSSSTDTQLHLHPRKQCADSIEPAAFEEAEIWGLYIRGPRGTEIHARDYQTLREAVADLDFHGFVVEISSGLTLSEVRDKDIETGTERLSEKTRALI